MLLLSPVQQLAVYSTLAVTLGLVAVRPRVGRTRPLSPALIMAGGIAVLIALGVVGWRELACAAPGPEIAVHGVVEPGRRLVRRSIARYRLNRGSLGSSATLELNRRLGGGRRGRFRGCRRRRLRLAR